MENKLIAFIEDTKRSVDDKTWFTFDRLTFETGKTTLKPESQEQLQNIAEILKAYPKVTLKLGGYTSDELAQASLPKVTRASLRGFGYLLSYAIGFISLEEIKWRNQFFQSVNAARVPWSTINFTAPTNSSGDGNV